MFISLGIFIYILVFFIGIFTFSLFHSILKPPKTSKKYPPSPVALPIIGHLHLLGPALPKSFQALSARYGPLMRIRMGSATSVIISNAAIAKEMLKDNEMNFVSRPVFGAADYNMYAGYSFILAEYGAYWKYMKKLCMTELLSRPRVNQFADVRGEETMKLLRKLVKCYEEEKACNLGMEILTMTNNVICRMVLGTTCSTSNGEENKLLVWEIVKGVEEIAIKLGVGDLFWGPINKFDLFGYGKKLRATLKKFDDFVEKIMAEHEKVLESGEKERKDILDMLLEVYRDENAEVKLNRKHIKSFILELFNAGTETTSAVLQWTLAELINKPKAYERLREEINTVVGSTRLVEESDIPNLPYLQAVVKEVLRLHPSAPVIFRRSEKDIKISGYDILANERTLFNIHAIMRDPSLWENPLDFLPERFATKSSTEPYDHYQMDLKGQNFSLIPFGSGRRGCPGASLALAAIHGLTARIVQCFDFQVRGGKKLNLEEGTGFSNGMAHPLICYPIPNANLLQLINGN